METEEDKKKLTAKLYIMASMLKAMELVGYDGVLSIIDEIVDEAHNKVKEAFEKINKEAIKNG